MSFNHKPWIENVSAACAHLSKHSDPGPGGVLIQIMDPDTDWWPEPRVEFAEIHRFAFLDAEDYETVPERLKISREQAVQIAAILKRALANKSNVVVHCHAGICRSGAVAEVGTMIGFAEPGRWRQPNRRVKRYLMDALNLTNNYENFEWPDTI